MKIKRDGKCSKVKRTASVGETETRHLPEYPVDAGKKEVAKMIKIYVDSKGRETIQIGGTVTNLPYDKMKMAKLEKRGLVKRIYEKTNCRSN